MSNTNKSKILRYVLEGLLLASFVSAKNVVPLTTIVDPETGKVKRQLVEAINPHLDDEAGHLVRREAKRLPLDLDAILNDENVGKREYKDIQHPFEDMNSVLESEEANDKDSKQMMPLCLDSRIPSINEISIFSSYLRSDLDVSARLENPQESTIIFAPSNDAIESLKLKPWQFPIDIDALEASTNDQEAIDNAVNENIMHFVKSHIVSSADLSGVVRHKCKGKKTVTFKSLAYEGDDDSGDILLKKKKSNFYVASAKDKEFHLVERVDQAENGVVLVIDTPLISD